MLMDYKRLIKSRSLRLKILRSLSFIPDKQMVKLQYRIKTGRKLNLKEPKRFTEKLQWYKLYYRNPRMIPCVDKYDVREYVKSKDLEDILVPCYGVYDTPDEIHWDTLPNQFVMKDTLSGGGISVIIVKDKQHEDLEELKRRAAEWVATDAHKRDGGREWPYYSGKKHRIIIEQYIEADEEKGGLIDYKFFCFHGEPTWIYVLADRALGNGVGLGIFDTSFQQKEALRADERPLKRDVEKPESFDRMLEISRILSEDFPEARIDLYDVDGAVKFGEITFFDGSGYMTFTPDEFDFTLGEAFDIHRIKQGE